MAITNAQLANQVSELLNLWRAREIQFRAWLAGTADGGDYGDGRYQLTSHMGEEYYVYCPAALADMVSGPAAAAQASASDAQSALADAQQAQSEAEDARDNAVSARDAAIAAKEAAEMYASAAMASEVNAETHRAKARKWANEDEDVVVEDGEYSAKHYALKASGTYSSLQADLDAATNDAVAQAIAAAEAEAAAAAASASAAAGSAAAASSAASAAAASAAAADSSAGAAAASAEAAAASAEAAATFDPDNFAPSVHTHSASDITSGTLSNARLSGVLAHQGGIGWGANLNTYTTTGIWHQNSDAGAASGTNYPVAAAGMLRVYADDVMVYQEYAAYGVNATYIRKHYNGVWQAWHQVYDSGHKPSPADLGAAAANHTHNYLPLSGGTISGALNINSGAGAFSLRHQDHVYMQFFNDAVNPNTRSAYFGFGGTGSPRLAIVNEKTGGEVYLGASNQIRFNAPSIVADGTLIINGGGAALSLRRGSQDRTYMTFYDDAVNPNTRSAYFGFGSADSAHLSIVNEKGGDIYFATGNQIRFNAPAIVVQGRGGMMHYDSSTFAGGRTYVSTAGPSGTPANGDQWIQYS